MQNPFSIKKLFSPPIFRTFTFVFLLSFLVLDSYAAWLTGYNYRKKVTIDVTKVSGGSDFTDFTVLVSVIDPELRVISSGGNVENANGFDIAFTNSDEVTLYDHQVEKYVSTTGEYVAWVKITTLSASANTEFYMYYGNPSVGSDPSVTSAWDANFVSVWHLNGEQSDHTSNTNDGTLTGTTDAVGKIAGGKTFDGVDDMIDCGNDGSLQLTTGVTLEMWINTSATGAYDATINKSSDFNWAEGYGMFLYDMTWMGFYVDDWDLGYIAWNEFYAQGSWLYVVGTWDGSDVLMYINGNLGSWTASFAGPMNAVPGNVEIGRGSDNLYCTAGIIDEVRISDVGRSQDWVTTSYNSANSPGTFMSFSSEEGNSILPIELIDFTATPTDNGVWLNWTTASETNNDYFTIERSTNKVNFAPIGMVDGSGDSHAEQSYTFLDEDPENGISYYRLKQTDVDGNFQYSWPISIDINGPTDQVFELSVFPNPADKNDFHLQLDGYAGQEITISLVNMLGETVHLQRFDANTLAAPRQVTLDNDIPAGAYFLTGTNGKTTTRTKVIFN